MGIKGIHCWFVVQYRPVGGAWQDDRWDRYSTWEYAIKRYRNQLKEEDRGWEWRIIRRVEEELIPEKEEVSC